MAQGPNNLNAIIPSAIEGVSSVSATGQDADRITREAAEPSATALDFEPYERPQASAYVMTPGQSRLAKNNFFAATLGDLVKMVILVVETESPIHRLDVVTRVAGVWGLRLGSRTQEQIGQACDSAEAGGLIKRGADYYWSRSSGDKCIFRSRAGTPIPGDRIASEEYQQVILAVLANGHTLLRTQLVNEVRGVFGFTATGPILDEAINSGVDTLLNQGKVGEASVGLRLRS
jgi:Protein of unknown function (DUF3320)